MLSCFAKDVKNQAVPITVITKQHYPAWLEAQSVAIKLWLAETQFRAEPGEVRLLPNADGKIVRVLCSVLDPTVLWSVGHLPYSLPEGVYQLDRDDPHFYSYAIAWGLGAYQFTRYKQAKRSPAQLSLPLSLLSSVQNVVESIYLVRDWINTPTDDMGPTEFAAEAEKLTQQYKATFTQIVGEDLLRQNYASIYTVGRASDDAPRLLDLRWGNPAHAKVTLVGKGVCFDSGGLDIKPSAYMLLMKKDMAGAAHVLGLARMIMAAKLPMNLRVLIPAVENAISGNAFRPGDVITSRKGLTIEVGNTDAEGRVILADALTEAVSEKPDLLIDLSTLTGAARIAVGTDLSAMFVNQDTLADDLLDHGNKQRDPMWRLTLFAAYREAQ